MNEHGQTKVREFLDARNGRVVDQSKPLEPLTIHFLLKSKHITESVWPRIVRISSPVLTLNTWRREKSVSSLQCVSDKWIRKYLNSISGRDETLIVEVKTKGGTLHL